MTNETDPTGKGVHEQGAKLDDGKVRAGLLADFSLAFLEVAKICTFGAKKYSVRGWEKVPGAQERYKDAQYRHMLAQRHEDFDKDSGLLHLAHEAWNCLARLELVLREDLDKN